jgi:hypothetical protein
LGQKNGVKSRTAGAATVAGSDVVVMIGLLPQKTGRSVERRR